ncbi:glutathione s-transferase theta-1 [Stylonychia lemnae]|uniref:Glutathione s-transferase theta-1 n=1 Tax=Stylonychia lemnae TaxID=5949 RepID=A0A078AG36_STYLE|nr:glutathione s-transferase theta-1 [Stylonychia lemnae]|eukprot:CDW81275.1 glutathione s-transferase theta-1 [Stylonychia lemnae]
MEDKPKITLYGDYASQPTRACYVFLKYNKVPFEFKQVRVTKLEQYSPEFKKINPNAKVPALTDGDISMFESHTILRYLHESRKLPDHWYPRTDFRERAKIDEYLDWHHNGIRLGAGGYIFRKYMSSLTGKPAPKESINESLMNLKKSFKLMEQYWLKDDKQKYLLGNELTLADFSCASEITQIIPSNIASILDGYPKVKAWFQRILDISEFNKVHHKAIATLSKYFQIIDDQGNKPKL